MPHQSPQLLSDSTKCSVPFRVRRQLWVCCYWLKLFASLLPFPFPHLDCHHGWQLLGAAILSLCILEMVLLETHEGKRRGNDSLRELSANLAGVQEGFPQSSLRERERRIFASFSVLFTLRAIRNVWSQNSLLNCKVTYKTLSQATGCASSWWVTGDLVHAVEQQCPLPYSSTL